MLRSSAIGMVRVKPGWRHSQGRRIHAPLLGGSPGTKRANHHYLEALAAVQDPHGRPGPIDQLASPVTRDKVTSRPESARAPRPAVALAPVIRAEYHLQGFRNEHIRAPLASDATGGRAGP